MLQEIETNWPAVEKHLHTIHQKLISKNGLLINITADAAALKSITPKIEQFAAQLPTASATPTERTTQPYPASEALLVPSRINFVGAAANLYTHGYQLHGSSLVITRYLQTAWLWEKIRVQGGAYGGMCAFDQRSGTFSFASYRDPNLEESIWVYQQTGQFLQDLKLDEAELTRALIGAIGQLDSHLLPDANALTSTKRYLIGYTDEQRQQFRDQVLSTNQSHFNQFGELLTRAFATPRLAVLCDHESAKKAGLKTFTEVL